MVLNFSGGGLFENRGLISKNQSFISLSGYSFKGYPDGGEYAAGACFFNSAGGADARSAIGVLVIPNGVTITKIGVYGTEGVGADVKYVIIRNDLVTGVGADQHAEADINTEILVDIFVDTSKYAYTFFVWDDNDAEENCRVNGAVVEFAWGDK